MFSEKLEFQAETRMLLDIVAKSLYSEKEVRNFVLVVYLGIIVFSLFYIIDKYYRHSYDNSPLRFINSILFCIPLYILKNKLLIDYIGIYDFVLKLSTC